MRKIMLALQIIVASLSLVALFGAPAAIGAATGCDSGNLTISSGIACGSPTSASQKPLFGKGGLFTEIADVLIFVIGAVAVLMIIIGALRYVLSAGNPSATNGAKDTILYAVIGLVVAVLAFAIVQFVVSKVG